MIDGQGGILIAEYVVAGSASITITFPHGAKRTASVIRKDDAFDIAVMHLNPDGLSQHPLSLDSDCGFLVRDAFANIGDPLGVDRTPSTGVVSSLGRGIQAPHGKTIAGAIQTNSAVKPGNSGGPPVCRGQAIGIADHSRRAPTSSDIRTPTRAPVSASQFR